MNPEDRLWRAFLLGLNFAKTDRTMGLDELLTALSSDESFDRAIESREQALERQLDMERKALLGIKVGT
jgi:hypothetical protein